MKRDFTNRYGKSPLKAILLSLLIIFILRCGILRMRECGGFWWIWS
ncbi:MAG TPA: hypothetical protein O0W90_00910 [Methanocorpusculum sp.]|nr:hypothetical protein [Methanocorpusculum sp.]